MELGEALREDLKGRLTNLLPLAMGGKEDPKKLEWLGEVLREGARHINGAKNGETLLLYTIATMHTPVSKERMVKTIKSLKKADNEEKIKKAFDGLFREWREAASRDLERV